jgi:Fe-S-cluster-containing dehydrogenase component/formate-dependent nitrite reductase membrane component NrfD
MTRWAWVIDQTRCIGCHACTTACKSENDVPVGSFRTWVKNVEVGTFPEVKRHFAVLRCNHCAEPPCVEVCPVTAMYQRPDGLVDFNHDTCIGCKACMQACPYDAIYMDPDSNTAAKCNFCSHRVDEGLLPACVVVCPEEALLFGDLEDPTSKVSRALAEHGADSAQPTSVRRAEQGTRPQAFYIGAHDATLDPLAARHDATFMWSDRGAHDHRELVPPPSAAPKTQRTLPIQQARVAYDVPRQRTWGWPVSSYIWTKGIAAGVGFFAALGGYVDLSGGTGRHTIVRVAPLIALGFLILTGALLAGDLKRPERFWTILIRPQWRSWLARGAFIITAFGAALTAWIVLVIHGPGIGGSILAPAIMILAALTAGYTAPLLAQCEGRDLWQSKLLLPHLLFHALTGGLAVLVIVGLFTGLHPSHFLGELLALLVLITGVLGAADAFLPHKTANARAAAHALRSGKQSPLFWCALFAGVVFPVILALAGGTAAIVGAAVLALIGLWLQGHAFILAGQGPPIS